MPKEPQNKRVYSFIDGQNLFYAAKEAFGYGYPNYDPKKLSQSICDAKGWNLEKVHFYTGIPNPQDDPFWYHFWIAKTTQLGRKGVKVFTRPLRYRHQTVRLPDGKTYTFLVGREKGVDVRLALDVVRLALEKSYDVCLILSQDQDITEAVEDIKIIAKQQDRWIKVACAFPLSPTSRNRRGIDKTDWIKIDRALFDSCFDPRDYRKKG